jgi:uncharacterized protein YxjI
MFDADSYEIRQKIMGFGQQYNIYENGEKILKSKQKPLKMKEDFRFYDTDGEPVLRVTTDQILDVAASYTVIDERNDETIGALKREFTFLQHRWEIIDSDNRVIGSIEEDNQLMAIIRRFIAEFVPFSYRIVAQNGDSLGELNGKLSLRDRYMLELTDDKDRLDRRLAVAAAVLVDAVEKN